MATKTTSTKTKRIDKEDAVESAAETVTKKEPIVVKDIDVHQYVTVRNGFQGHLVYKSPKTGEIFHWYHFGDSQDMELQELRNAKASAKNFFTNNWFMFDEPWVVDYLGMGKCYDNALTLDEFDTVFDLTADKLAKVVNGLSLGQKRSLTYKARKLIESGEIDSNKKIAVLEKALGVELIER